MDHSIQEAVTHSHKPNCAWLHLNGLTVLSDKDVPPLHPNPELSGIGVILGFSLSAYLTLLLLILHYITVYNIRRSDTKGNLYINAVDDGVLTYIRTRLTSWSPSRRFEYAMEKSVLILSDLNLVTGLGIVLSGYSQLNYAISAYHWQTMVFVAWFASFSFLSAMTFLEGYFQTNSSMRIIRVMFMVVLASLLIAALLPTGSSMWLNQYSDDHQGFYPSLSTVCFYKELGMSSFRRHGPKLWSMAFSVVVVALSYIHSGIRLFDSIASTSRRYLRTVPGSLAKRLLHAIELKASSRGFIAHIWHILYLILYAGFISSRAFYDISESMLLEIIWLTFAMAWGTIKVWETRAAATQTFDGQKFTTIPNMLEENTWSFGQTLPLVLLLLPVLSMVQAYLDNDAKAQEEMQNEGEVEEFKHLSSTSGILNVDGAAEAFSTPNCGSSPTILNSLPKYPYGPFTSYSWYTDHILLIICQIITVTTVALYILTRMGAVFGISSILRNRLFLIWVFTIIPLASFIHLAMWYGTAILIGRLPKVRRWLIVKGKVVYWVLRLGLVAGCLTFTLLVSFELAGPDSLLS